MPIPSGRTHSRDVIPGWSQKHGRSPARFADAQGRKPPRIAQISGKGAICKPWNGFGSRVKKTGPHQGGRVQPGRTTLARVSTKAFDSGGETPAVASSRTLVFRCSVHRLHNQNLDGFVKYARCMPIAILSEETPWLIVTGTLWKITYVLGSGIECFQIPMSERISPGETIGQLCRFFRRWI